MTMRRNFVICLSLTLLVAGAAMAQTTSPYDIELGYRWLNLSGREDMYRTQIDERNGFFVRALTLQSNEQSSAFDHYRLDVNDLGQTPAGMLRFEGGKSGAYKLNFTYRRNELFSALPGFANPLLGQGVLLGQHTFDRTRNLFDVDVTFLPDGKFAPFIGYTMNRYSGPGTTTYALGQDEYQLFSDLKDKDQEIRGGFNFSSGKFSGLVLGGYRQFDGRENLGLLGAASGNNNFPILGRNLSASQIARTDITKVKAPFANAYATMQATSRVRLIANFNRFASDSKGSQDESASGSFISFPLSAYFGGLTDTVDSRAKNTTWRGGLRTEISVLDNVDFLAGWQRESRDLSGSALIDTILLQSITFGGVNAGTITDLVNANNSLNRKEDVFNAALSARALGPFAVRVGFAQSRQDVTVTPDLSEIVVPGNDSGNFKRTVNTFDSNVSYAAKGFTIGGAWRYDHANQPILRTDFLSRDRYRLRAAWAAPKWVRLGLTGEETKQNNDQPGTNYNSTLKQFGGDVEVVPTQVVHLRAGAFDYRGDTSILFRQPQNFQIGTSVWSEKGTSYEGGIGLTFTKFSVDADFTRFNNKGTTPFTIDRYRTRLTYDFKPRVGIAAEFSKDKYTENPFQFGDYDANRIGLFLRLRP